MKLEHRFSVPATVEETWTAFLDLERVVPCFPGATLGSFDGEEFTGSCKVKLGPISLVYNGSGRFAERDETLRRAVLEAKGKDRRGNGTANATVTAQLTATDPDNTSVVVETDLTITGKPAQFGRGVMQDVSDKMLAQFADCLRTKLGPAPAGEEPAAEEPEEPAAEAPVAGAAGGAPVGGAPVAGAPVAGAPEAGDDQQDSALDLGATVLPVLARRYGPYLGAVLGLVATVLLIRRLLR